jgi:hypothetical protein
VLWWLSGQLVGSRNFFLEQADKRTSSDLLGLRESLKVALCLTAHAMAWRGQTPSMLENTQKKREEAQFQYSFSTVPV